MKSRFLCLLVVSCVFCPGGRKANDIVAWVTRQTGPAATSLDTIDAAKAFSEQADVVVIGYFEDFESQEAKSYTTAADTIEEPIPFGITNVKEVMEGMEASPNTIVMYKKVRGWFCKLL